VFLAVGELDALLAAASFVSSHMDVCAPRFCDQRNRWAVTAIRHPLLPEAIANDFDFDPGPALITGSNMSGKTTFLKTLGVNAVLAQTLGLVFARSYTMPILVVRTSIGRADNLIEGRSYYLAEVESVRRLVEVRDAEPIHLLLADELFRGTNPDERIAAASEVLRHLAATRHLVLAATHDLELVELLAHRYRSFHFSETVAEHGLRFDYRLRPGPCRTRNAIALLEHAGYPAELVRRARAAAEARRAADKREAP
jgi:DNA mismatch repair ATPase MutS